MNDDTNTGSITAETPKEMTFPPLRFDPQAYMDYVKDADLTEAEAHELLQAIWLVITSFVDMRFGIHPIQQAIKGRNGDSSLDRDSSRMVNCSDKSPTKAKRHAVPHRSECRRRRKDS